MRAEDFLDAPEESPQPKTSALEYLLADDQSYPSAVVNAASREAVSGVGHAMQGAAAAAEISGEYLGTMSPETGEVNPFMPDYKHRTPAQTVEAIQSNPIFKKGAEIADIAPETYPVAPEREKQLGPKVAGMLGGFVPLVASGPAAPATIALQSLGAHIDEDWKAAKKEGLSDDEAATRALNRGILSGGLQASIFLALPKPLRAAGEKLIIDKFGTTAFKDFIAGRVAIGAEGLVLGAASTAAENVVAQRPIGENVTTGAAGMGALNLLMPPYTGRGQIRRAISEAATRPPPVPPETMADAIERRANEIARANVGTENQVQAPSPVHLVQGQPAEAQAAPEAPVGIAQPQSNRGTVEPIPVEPPVVPSVDISQKAKEAAGQPEIQPDIEPGRANAPAVPPVQPVVEPPPATTQLDPNKFPVQEFPVEQLKLSEDVPNFKGGASPITGVVAGQELEGKYQRLGTAPIVVWQRNNGNTEVITGRHRLDLARRSGEKTIPVQIVRESDGFTKDQALTFDAEANIRDGQGEVADYATYFKGTNISEAEAGERGLLSRAKGKAGWSLAKSASDDLYALWRSGKVSDAQAVSIASAAPRDASLQQVGIRFALKGKSGEFLSNVIKASRLAAGESNQSFDLFGNDDSAMKAMESQANYASEFRREISNQILAVEGAAKRPETAKKLGVDVRDPEGIAKKLAELRAEYARWENWPSHPDLVARVREAAKPYVPTVQAKPVPAEELMSPDEFAKQSEFSGDTAKNVHIAKIKLALMDGKPVSAESVSRYKIEVPDGYQISEDKKTFEKPVTPVRPANPPEAPTVVKAEAPVEPTVPLESIKKGGVKNETVREEKGKEGLQVEPPVVEPPAKAAPFSDNSTVQIKGQGPALWRILKETTDPRFPDERLFDIQNDKTGEIQRNMDMGSLKPAEARSAEERAAKKGKSKSELQDELLKLRPDLKSVVRDYSVSQLRDMIKRERDKRKGEDPSPNLGDGLPEGEGWSDFGIRSSIHGVDTVGFPVEIVSRDEAASLTGRENASGWGGFFYKGKIYLVRDNIRAGNVEGLRRLLREEVGHGLLRTPEGLKLFSEALDAGKLNLTEAEKQKLLEQGYKDEGNTLLDEFIAKSAMENRTWWQDLIARVKRFFTLKGFKATNAEVARALLRTIQRKLRYESIDETSGGELESAVPAPGASELTVGEIKAINRELNGLNDKEKKSPADNRRIAELERKLGQQDLFAAPETKSEEDIAIEAERARQQAEIQRRQSKRLIGGSIEDQGGLFAQPKGAAAQEDMFSAPSPKTESPPEPVEPPKKVGQQSLFGDIAPGEPVRGEENEPERRRAQVLGLKMGREYEVQAMRPVVDAVRAIHFDSRPAASPERTTQAFDFARALTGDNTATISSTELKNALGSDKNDAGLQILQNELMDYATKLTLNGDPSLSRYLIDNWGSFAKLPAGAGLSEAARALRAVQESKTYRLFQMLNVQAVGSREAARRGLGIDEATFNDLQDALNRVNVDPTTLETELLQTPTGNGQTFGDFLRPLLTPEGVSPDLLNRIADAIGMDRGVMSKLEELVSDAAKKNMGVRLTKVNESEASRVMANLQKLFPNFKGWRELFTEKGTRAIADNFFQLLAGPAAKPEPNVGTFEKVVSSELSRLLRQAMSDAGYDQTTTPKQSTAEKIALFLGNDPLRSDKLAQIDEKVRKEIEGRPEEMADQLTDLWDNVMGVMRDSSSSNTMARRIVTEVLKDIKPNWPLLLDGGETGIADLRRRVIEETDARIQNAATPRAEGESSLDLTAFNNLAGLMFDNVVATRRNARSASRALSGTMKAENLTERQAAAELDRLERTQTEWLKPDGVRNQVKEMIRVALKGSEADKNAFVTALSGQFEGIGVKPETARRLAEEVFSQKQAANASAKVKADAKQATDLEKQAKALANKYELTVFPGKGEPGLLLKTIQDYLKPEDQTKTPPVSERLMVDELGARLVDIGVTPKTAYELAYDVYLKRESNWRANRVAQQERASEKGSIWSLVKDIQQTPYLAQKSPTWRTTMAENWFMRNGLSREQAQAAAKTFNAAFEKKMLEAGEEVAKKILSGKVNPSNMADIIRGVRSGLLDPSRNWSDTIAAREGWKPISPEQFKKLAELELKAADPKLSPAEFAAAEEEMMAIMRHVGDKNPKGTYWRRISEGFVSSLLSGPKTLIVQATPVLAAMRDYPVLALSDPENVGTYLKSMIQAAQNVFLPEFKYAWKKDAYGYHPEALEFEHKELTRWAENLEKDYAAAKNPAEKAWIRTKQLYAAQQYVSRTLSTIDQAMMASTREMKLASYSSLAMKEAGLSTHVIANLVDQLQEARRYNYQKAIDDGLDDLTARVRANAALDQTAWEFVTSHTAKPELADQVLKSVQNDISMVVGRKAPGISEGDEGMLSKPMNALMEAISGIRSKGGPNAVLAVALTGFVNVPWRTTRYFSGFSPYGLLRYGIYRYRNNHGYENYWKQSFGTELQAKQRLREAIAGTAVMAIVSAWAAGHTTADDEANDKNKKFGMYVTGAGPSRKEMRDSWVKTGWRPYSLNFLIDGAHVTIPITRVGEAIMWPLMLAAAIDDTAWKRKEQIAAGKQNVPGWETFLSTAFGTGMYMSGQKGIMQGVVQIAQAAQGGQGILKSAAKIGGGTLSASAIPFKQLIASASDMMMGQLDQSSASALIASQFPIFGIPWQKKAINRYGDEIGDRSWFGIIQRTGVPIAFKLPGTPVNREMYPVLVEKGASPPELRRYIVEERYGTLTNDQFSDFAQKSGSLLKQSVVSNLSQIKGMTPDQVKEFLQKAASQADKTAAAALGLTPVAKTQPATETTSQPAVAVAARGSGGGAAVAVARPVSRSAFRSGFSKIRGTRQSFASMRKIRLRRPGRIRSRYSTGFRRQSSTGKIRSLLSR